MKAAILTDLTRCIGCGACTIACKDVNSLPGSEVNELDAYTWCAIRKEHGLFVKRQCMHCLEPTCASVCPVAALHKTPWGAVDYNADRCIGCRYCIMACPFNIPKYQWDDPLPKVGKCIMCSRNRLRRGRQPACTEACPTGATVFGDRDRLIAVARNRLLKYPNKYVSRIYGLKTAGGTSVMYLSSVPFEKLGFPADVLDEPYPELTWAILSKVPHIVSIGGLSLLGIWWVIERRIQMERKRRLAAGMVAFRDDMDEHQEQDD